MKKNNMGYSKKIALTSVFGALALAVSLATSGIPYPIAPFLKIDFSEIIDLLAFFIGGEFVGILTVTLHFLGLMINAEFIIGPPLKYIAVLSMFLGLYISKLLFGDYWSWTRKATVVATLISSLVRSVVMILVNLVVILYVAPEFYGFFEYQLGALGFLEVNFFTVILYMSLIIGSYNMIQTIFAMAVGEGVFNAVKRYFYRR